MTRCILVLTAIHLLTLPVQAQVRIKDITDMEGARNNQLYGFGLVTGLDGTGSRSTFTQQVAVDMLQKMSVGATIFSQLPSDNVIRSTSISAVMVTAEIGPFARKGSRIDVNVSALDDARSLLGGMLIMTALRGADGETYAVAQGPLSIGGFSIGGQGGGGASGATKNQVNVGRIPNGAIIEKEALGQVFKHDRFRLLLKDPDFNTARLIAKAINEHYPDCAAAQDGGTVGVCVPPFKAASPPSFASEVGLFEVYPDATARVVINERTGTVVAGDNVTVATTAVAHGNLYLYGIIEGPTLIQQNPLGGETAIIPRYISGAREQRARLNVVSKTTTVAELARGLNALGVTPRDLISIFQSLKQAGALNAEIVVQ